MWTPHNTRYIFHACLEELKCPQTHDIEIQAPITVLISTHCIRVFPRYITSEPYTKVVQCLVFKKVEIILNLIYLSYIVYMHKIYALYKQSVLNSASETWQLQYFLLRRPPLHTIHHNSEASLHSLYWDIYSDINLAVVSTTNAP